MSSRTCLRTSDRQYSAHRRSRLVVAAATVKVVVAAARRQPLVKVVGLPLHHRTAVRRLHTTRGIEQRSSLSQCSLRIGS